MEQIMSYIELMNRLWAANKVARFTQSERDLYYYLLNECNQNFWRQPISCPTSVIISATGLSKQTLMRAREGLKERGFITYSKGAQNIRAPHYSIVTNETACVTANETANETARGTADETARETIIYKTKDKNKNNLSSLARKESQLISIEELKVSFIEATAWKEDVRVLLAKEKTELREIEEIDKYILQFFDYLHTSGITQKDEIDCRNHFINCLKKQLEKSEKTTRKYASNTQGADPRRGSIQVNAGSKADYEAPF
ncbi:MAG: hypothetical protein ACRCZY_00810 [Phocaeicola sp.]